MATVPSIGLKQGGNWEEFRTYNVNHVVIYNGSYWTNITGNNDEPSATSDNWLFIGSIDPVTAGLIDGVNNLQNNLEFISGVNTQTFSSTSIRFPTLTNALIDDADANSAVQKGWVLNQQQGAASTLSQQQRYKSTGIQSTYKVQSGQITGTSVAGILFDQPIVFAAVNNTIVMMIRDTLLGVNSTIDNFFDTRGRIVRVHASSTQNIQNTTLTAEQRDIYQFFSTTPYTELTNLPSDYTAFAVVPNTQNFFRSGAVGDLSDNPFVSFEWFELNRLVTETFRFQNQAFDPLQDITLLPAPGANRFYRIIEASATKNITTAYGANPQLTIVNGALLSSVDLGLITTGSEFSVFDLLADNNLALNQPVVLRPDIAATGGVGTIKIHMAYMILDVL